MATLSVTPFILSSLSINGNRHPGEMVNRIYKKSENDLKDHELIYLICIQAHWSRLRQTSVS
jgi:hypothetical protein